MSIDKAIENAAASLQMEGFEVEEKSKELVKQVLEKKISLDQYINIVKNKYGVKTK